MTGCPVKRQPKKKLINNCAKPKEENHYDCPPVSVSSAPSLSFCFFFSSSPFFCPSPSVHSWNSFYSSSNSHSSLSAGSSLSSYSSTYFRYRYRKPLRQHCSICLRRRCLIIALSAGLQSKVNRILAIIERYPGRHSTLSTSQRMVHSPE